MLFLGWEDPLEEGKAIHCSILAWTIPMDTGTWLAAVQGVARSQTRLSDFDFSLKLPVSGIFLPRSHCLTSSFLGSGLSQHLATPMNNPLMEEMEETVLTSLNPDILRQQLPTACVQRESRMSVFVTMSWSPGGEGPQCLSV